MKVLKSHIVPNLENDSRLLDYCLDIFRDFILSKSMLKKKIKKGAIKLNGKDTNGSEWLKEGQEITLLQIEENPPMPFNLDLDIVFEDEQLAVIVKPAGIVVSGNQYRTIVNAIQYNIKKSTLVDALPWPRPIHRLDMQTSGLLIVAKTQLAAVELGKQLENKTLRKRYRAIVMNKAPEKASYTSDIDGFKSHTELVCIETTKSIKSNYLSLVDLHPHTGRTHQLRIHCSQNHLPILGDKLYGPKENTKLHKGLFLSAVEISFIHPKSKTEVNLSIEQPKKFDTLLEREKIMWQKKLKG
ncbi:MAG: RluA family pseudouridine synthase [Flavobacteriales bacterium]|nr:RluA family pseudouridine synthase [Flavobacteriales bacterium]